MKKKKLFSNLILLMTINLLVASILIGITPGKAKAATTVSNKLTLSSTTGMYNNPADNTPIGYLNPQTVTVDKTWHLINTWLGPKFIRFDYMSTARNTVTLQAKKTPLYNNPNTPSPVGYLAPQKVTVIENWYSINTKSGKKFVVIDNLSEATKKPLVLEEGTVKGDGSVQVSNTILRPDGSIVNPGPVLASRASWTIKAIQDVLKKNKTKIQNVINKSIDTLPLISKKTKTHWKKIVAVEVAIKALSSISGFTGNVEDGLTKAFTKLGVPGWLAGGLARTISFIFF
ncbi:hypothetical protein M3611_23505 [Priestia megaterium]|uniref:hypothetical protein n=1 Tax=Priestia megaterium TaxID=1404 RepID=UPI00203DDA4E|nr:hypothetical protein [Priestia megaterium]MCM3154983.1 hypothetical protein [Priestia megaterium]